MARAMSNVSNPALTLTQVPNRIAGSAGLKGHSLNIRNLTHRFGNAVAVDNISLHINPGHLLALLGPSGCGKTTLLRAIAGFVRPSHGEVLIDGEDITHVPARSRKVGIVFQSYALFPHLSVEDNIAYGLRSRGAPRAEIAATVDAMLDLVRLHPMRKRNTRQLSGGQQQRVAVARALAVRPRVLLLDEPFSALDRGLRLDMQIEIKRIQQDLGITTVLVTHDQDEALSMADTIAVMNNGRLCQLGAPMDIYDRPSDPFVNGFIGSTNLIPARVERAQGVGSGVRIETNGMFIERPIDVDFHAGDPVMLSVRPERWRIFRQPDQDRLAGTVTVAMPLGPTVLYELKVRDLSIKARVDRNDEASVCRVGEAVHIAIDRPHSCPIFPRSQVPEVS
jgi:putative spermidine/putrescine transport system ATP-binding protein